MKGTRELALDLLRQRGELTVAELAQVLEIAAPAVRRHLDILASEGLVDYRTVKQHTGRPYFVYFPTERARERESTGYSRLVERLLREVSALDDGAGTGHRLLETVLDRMSEHLAEEHRGKIHGATLVERVASLVSTLSVEGVLDDFEIHEDGVHLVNSTCPYRRAAIANPALCHSEARAITMLLGTEVEQMSRIADGQHRCEYVVCSTRPGAVPVAIA
ncbi:MAG: helix-turn-helix transcriptional regulator [Dehalococcoidia bacterium]